MEQATCRKCNLPVLANFYFCPNCGYALRPKPLSISAGKQIGIYLLSFLLPPLGVWPGIKYLMQKDPKAKIVGAVAILLTIISIVVTLYYANILMKQLTTQLNAQLGGQVLPR